MKYMNAQRNPNHILACLYVSCTFDVSIIKFCVSQVAAGELRLIYNSYKLS